MNYFKDKIILLTGATGGLGREFTNQLLMEGARIILADINETGLEKMRVEIQEQSKHKPGSILGIISADLSSSEGCDTVYADCMKISSTIDILINNAGILTYGYFYEHPDNVIRKLIEVNVLAPMILTRKFLPNMVRRGRGHIVLVSSLASVIPTAFETSYTASKCALRGFGMALSREVCAHGINVTNIYPSFADTNMLRTPSFGSAKVRQIGAFMIDSPLMVVKISLNGIKRRKLHVYPGFNARISAFAAKFFPLIFSLPVKNESE